MAAAILDRVLERGRFIHLDGPSRRTRYLNLEEILPAGTDRARISGTHTIWGKVSQVSVFCPCSGYKSEQNGATEASDSPLFSCVSLHGFVPRVGRNCAHNPKVVSSNLTPATNQSIK